MLRKTAAIAVLILFVSSLFAGSVSISPAKGQAGASREGYRGALDRLAFATITKSAPVEAYASRAAGAGGPHVVVAGGAGVTEVAGVPEAGLIPPEAAGCVVSGMEASADGAGWAGTIMVLTNESRIEFTGTPGAGFAFGGDLQGLHLKSWPAGPKLGTMTALRAASIIIHSPVLMFRPGGTAPERYDMKFESHRALTGAPDGFGFFSGHLEMPWGNGSGLAFGPDGLFATGGAIELNGSLVVDLANLTLAGDTTAAADTYNNEISGGQTNWHSVDLSRSVSSFNVDLKWANANDSLRLVLYSPDGKILGPYYDSSDGTTDGRINLNIANPSGVAAGQWHLKVTDMTSLGSDDYYVKTY